jgi:hypothetical protein
MQRVVMKGLFAIKMVSGKSFPSTQQHLRAQELTGFHRIACAVNSGNCAAAEVTN